MTAPGHVFVVRGDATGIACDWRIIPSGLRVGKPGHIRAGWLKDQRVAARVGSSSWPTSAPDSARRAVVVVKPGDGPGVIAVHTGESGHEGAAWFAEALVAAGKIVVKRRSGESPPLVVVPLLGTGGGGGGWQRAGVVEELLSKAKAVASLGIDVVLALDSAQAYAAAQRLRAREPGSFWADLGGQGDRAERLAAIARAGKLVPFVGAGVSMAAGLPSWKELLRELAEAVGTATDADMKQLEALDPRDAALVLERRLGDSLDRHLRERFSKDRPSSLTHALLASLPVKEAATTNYDRLFEQAWRKARGGAVHVLPKQDVSAADHWLLKLHGDVDDKTRPLVLSRAQYLGFAQTGGAVAGVLQAMLLTRHLLIVGYGLTDETFHRIAHDVRAVRASVVAPVADKTIGGRLGTALLVNKPGLTEEIWSADLDLLSFDRDSDDLHASVRRQSIFLDRVGHLAAPIESYVLGEGFESLSEKVSDRDLRDALTRLQASAANLDPEMRRAVDEVLVRFGASEPEV